MTGRDELAERLEACYTSAVHDVMRARGYKDFVPPPEIRPPWFRRVARPAPRSHRAAILAGADPREAYLKYGKFRAAPSWPRTDAMEPEVRDAGGGSCLPHGR